MMIYDIIGKKFGRLTVVSFNNKVGEYQYYLCRCDCGNEKVVNRRELKAGHTKSCGCLHKELLRKPPGEAALT